MKLHTKNGGERVDFTDSEYDDQPERAADLIADVLLALLIAGLAGSLGVIVWQAMRLWG